MAKRPSESVRAEPSENFRIEILELILRRVPVERVEPAPPPVLLERDWRGHHQQRPDAGHLVELADELLDCLGIGHLPGLNLELARLATTRRPGPNAEPFDCTVDSCAKYTAVPKHRKSLADRLATALLASCGFGAGWGPSEHSSSRARPPRESRATLDQNIPGIERPPVSLPSSLFDSSRAFSSA